MINIPDIKQKIISDFGEKSDEAVMLILEGLSMDEFLNHPRIIRCVIHLSEKSINGLKKAIKLAQGDPRDVMYLAEYINRIKLGEAIRVRDYNEPFLEQKKDINLGQI